MPPATVTAPRPPELPPPRRLPIVATIAPLVVSLVLFAVTRSPFTLVFAALGPVVAIASVVDGALQSRRIRTREKARFEADVARVAREIAEAHAAECSVGRPGLAEVLARPALVLRQWATGDDAIVRLGTGGRVSELRYSSTGTPGASLSPEVEASLAELRSSAERIEDAPVELDLAGGLGISGRTTIVTAVLRSIVGQLAASLSPEHWSVAVPADCEEWLRALPHPASLSGRSSEIVFVNAGRVIRIVFAPTPRGLPRELPEMLDVGADGMGLTGSVRLRLDLASRQQATTGARLLTELAATAGIRRRDGGLLPESILRSELQPAESFESPSGSGTLATVVGFGTDGPLTLDLVSDGPHAIVGGTTGSGKSELLLSWILGMAANRSPEAVSFLFVDFKGGASFGSLLELPHSVGVLTDLDAAQAHRALTSLAAELRRRERLLAEHGLRGVDESEHPPFARLVVVVDEFAALVETLPELHAIFADIASRGRSLGVHLILCTQRPAGVVRDGILANCALRLSLRVTSAADSSAVLGTPEAAALPPRPLGRALVSVGGGEPAPFQVALSRRTDVDSAIERWAGAPRPPAPWLPPLPALVPLEALGSEPAPGDIRFALADLPGEQEQRPVAYRPRRDGSLLVVGAAGSGKTGVLAALAASPSAFETVRVPMDLAGLWDVVRAAVSERRDTPSPRTRVLLFDDLDGALSRCEDAYQAPLVDLLSRVIRDGPADHTWCVFTAQRLGGALHGLAALCGSQLLLRMPSRAEHALAGGDPTHFVPGLPPGAGYWRGNRVQVAAASALPIHPIEPRAMVIDPHSAAFAVVSTRPERFAALLRERAPGRRVVPLAPGGYGDRGEPLEVTVGDAPAILVGDPDLWQSQWSLLGSLQRAGDLIFDGCSLAEVRALTRSRELPPPFPSGVRPLWLRTVDGELIRASLESS